MSNTIRFSCKVSQVEINGAVCHGADAGLAPTAWFVNKRGPGVDGFGRDRVLYGNVTSDDWTSEPRRCLFIGINPSTATHLKPDPTITRDTNFARAWGYNIIMKGNLFGYRSAYPKDLLKVDNPEGDPENMQHILRTASIADIVVCSWGGPYSPVALQKLVSARAERVVTELRKVKPLHMLALTKDGFPRHTLCLKSDLKPVPWIDSKGEQ